jgi:hypothetical protein
MTITEELKLILDHIPNISPDKKYWLIRTQGGILYDIFINNKIVAIEHNLITNTRLKEIQKNSGVNVELLSNSIKEEVRKSLRRIDPSEEIVERDVTLKSNQITRFAFEIKKGDVVIIPSKDSDYISLGVVTSNDYFSETINVYNESPITFDLLRRVKWEVTVPRYKLDPNLYRLFTSHQTIVNADFYAESIERTLNDLYVLNDDAHIILEVQQEGDIPAKDLFGLGYELLQLVDEYAKFAGLEISSNDLAVQVNLNSPGKIDYKSKIKSTTVIMGLILLVAGGGYEDKQGNKLKTDGLPGIVKSISKFLSDQDDREMKKELFTKYKDSLHIKNPDDLNKALKQFSDNKDLPK